MSYAISAESCRAAAACKKHFECTSGRTANLCKVEHCVDGKVHFVRCVNVVSCSFQRNFGGANYCDCAVRKELFNKYGV